MGYFIKGFLRLIFKIIALPFIVALTVLVPFMMFLFSLSVGICSLVGSLLCILGVLLCVTGTDTLSGIMVIIMGFLISPFGIPSVAAWLIGLIDELNYSLKKFVTSYVIFLSV